MLIITRPSQLVAEFIQYLDGRILRNDTLRRRLLLELGCSLHDADHYAGLRGVPPSADIDRDDPIFLRYRELEESREELRLARDRIFGMIESLAISASPDRKTRAAGSHCD